MGFLTRNRKSSTTDNPSRASVVSVDDSLADGPWLQASESAYRTTISAFYGSPETMASGGQQRERCGDAGVALFFYQKSIDMLHSAYGFSNMQSRRPSPQDTPILDGFVRSLGTTLSAHPDASVSDSIREVTHRLRSISTTATVRALIRLSTAPRSSALESLPRT
jgi:hypothetical protein